MSHIHTYRADIVFTHHHFQSSIVNFKEAEAAYFTPRYPRRPSISRTERLRDEDDENGNGMEEENQTKGALRESLNSCAAE